MPPLFPAPATPGGTGSNLKFDRFTSGGSTAMPCARASSVNCSTLSVSFITADMLAAMNAAA